MNKALKCHYTQGITCMSWHLERVAGVIPSESQNEEAKPWGRFSSRHVSVSHCQVSATQWSSDDIQTSANFTLTIDTPISRPHGRAMGCLLWGFGENSPNYNGITLYYHHGLAAVGLMTNLVHAVYPINYAQCHTVLYWYIFRFYSWDVVTHVFFRVA